MSSLYYPILTGFLFSILVIGCNTPTVETLEFRLFVIIFSIGFNWAGQISLAIRSKWRDTNLAGALFVLATIASFIIGMCVMSGIYYLDRHKILYFTSTESFLLCHLMAYTLAMFLWYAVLYYIFEQPGKRWYVPTFKEIEKMH